MLKCFCRIVSVDCLLDEPQLRRQVTQGRQSSVIEKRFRSFSVAIKISEESKRSYSGRRRPVAEAPALADDRVTDVLADTLRLPRIHRLTRTTRAA